MTGIYGGKDVIQGVGSPEGVVAARVGTIYERLDGGAGSTLYVKESGGTASVGWVSYTGGGVAAQIPAFIQAKQLVQTSSATTIVLAFDNPIQAHNLVVVGLAWGSGTVESITSMADGLSNTYTRITACDQADATSAEQHSMFYAKNVNAGTCTITATFPATRDGRRIIIAEYSGLSQTAPLDQAASAFQANPGQTTDAVNPGSLTPSASNALIVGLYNDTTGGPLTLTAGTNFTKRAGNTSSPVDGLEDQVLVTPGAVSARWTLDGDHRSLSAMAIFKP